MEVVVGDRRTGGPLGVVGEVRPADLRRTKTELLNLKQQIKRFYTKIYFTNFCVYSILRV